MGQLRRFRKFINGQYLNMGIRVTASVIVPSLILYHFDLLASFISIPLGAMCIGLTDNPGPFHHRKNSLTAAVITNFFVALISGYLNANPFFLVTEIIFFGMFFSLIGVYGNRIISIGTIALYVFVFGIDTHLSGIHILYNALFFTAGGIWYLILALLLYRLKPYKIIQQLLGEDLVEISNYLQLKAAFYLPHKSEENLYDELMKSQVAIQQQQDDLREIIFKTRRFVSESNVKGRTLLLLFLNSIDLFEMIITSQQDYVQLHKDFDGTNILPQYYSCINLLSNELRKTALAVQSGDVLNNEKIIDNAMAEIKNVYNNFRNKFLKPENIEGFIKLKNILDSLEDISKSIKQLQFFTAYDKRINRKFRDEVDVSLFVSHNEIDPKLLRENFTLRSNNFRHALRVTFALLIGYFVSLFFPIGHGYWILLTIVTIIKPSYSITKRRNLNRLSGTIAGAAIGFLMLFFVHDKTIIFIIMLVAMIIAYSFFRLNYFVSSIGITLYVLLAFYFLNPHGFQTVLSDRIIDTAIGSFIAFIVSITFFPNWEHEKTGAYILKALEANRKYFAAASSIFTEKIYNVNDFKLARKNAFVALANLSDSFQRMLSEPKNRQPNMEEYHQFAATSQLLTSYIASLSYYAQNMNEKFATDDFESFVMQIDKAFQQAVNIYNQQPAEEIAGSFLKQNVHIKIEELLERRKKEIVIDKDETTSARKNLLPLKTIVSQLELINAVITDEVKILRKIYPEKII
jgi:uncharacterized membrane protein (TIGR01666 family)